MSKGILTKREKEVFSLLIENKTTREIANILSISEKDRKSTRLNSSHT